MNKKKILYAGIAILLIAFCVIPFHSSNCIVRLHYSDIDEADSFYLLYATKEEAEFGGDKTIEAFVNPEGHVVEFVIPSELNGDITALRLDFPGVDQTVSFDSVFVLSGSVVRKSYGANRFFSPEFFTGTNGIDAIQTPSTELYTYIVTSGNDPYIVLSDKAVAMINKGFSSYFVTKLLISLFIGGCIFLYEKEKRS
ncbi:MAG: hypothetical protein J6X36_00300 [Lachnospiraceae bacterium]|nr:hypothetical protein [Lachnospiraceae bacterium]